MPEAAPPTVKRVSHTLVHAFAHMIDQPSRWFTVDEVIAAAGGGARSTIYRRFANLVAAKALSSRRIGDHRHFKLHPEWDLSQLARDLHQRSLASRSAIRS